MRAQEIARENKLPLVYLVESGGANLMYQSEIFVVGGRSFCQPGSLVGSRFAADCRGTWLIDCRRAYLPGLSDYVVLVRDRSSIYLAGPHW